MRLITILAILFFYVTDYTEAKTKANAGLDQVISNNQTWCMLNAQLPQGYAGYWTILSGNDGLFDDYTFPQALFRGAACTEYILRQHIFGVQSMPLWANKRNQ